MTTLYNVMNFTYDPSWGVPVIGLTICVVGVLWGHLSRRAFDRKYGPDPK